MGLMDKVKQQAEQALVKAQQGVSQGQAKLDQVQAKRQADALLRDLGAAYYASQRTGGSSQAVESAMRLVDEHVAAHGGVDEASKPGAGAAEDGDGAEQTGGTHAHAGGAPGSASGGAPAGSFSIDDM